MPIREFDIPLTCARSGEIQKRVGFGTTWFIRQFATGERDPQAGLDYQLFYTDEHRTFLSFDTSSLDTEGVVLDDILRARIFFSLDSVVKEEGADINWIHRLYMGKDWLGAALDSADWNAALFRVSENFDYGTSPPTDPVIFELPANRFNQISLNGRTEFCIRDVSGEDPANSSHWVVFDHDKQGDARFVITIQGAVEEEEAKVFYNLGG